MPILPRRVGVLVVVAIFSVSPLGGAAGLGPDAGTGTDAGSNVSGALGVGSFGLIDGSASANDIDVYRIDVPSTSARCVSTTLGASFPSVVSLGSTLNGAIHGVGRTATGSATVALATLASDAVLPYVERTSAGSSISYSLSFSVLPLPQSVAGDQGTSSDVGDTISGAPVISQGCTGGTIGKRLGVPDAGDTYRTSAAAGDTIFATFATPDSTARLSILSATGQTLTTIAPGERASVPVSTADIYHVRVYSDSQSSNGYLIALVIGPDPGSSCRPMC